MGYLRPQGCVDVFQQEGLVREMHEAPGVLGCVLHLA